MFWEDGLKMASILLKNTRKPQGSGLLPFSWGGRWGICCLLSSRRAMRGIRFQSITVALVVFVASLFEVPNSTGKHAGVSVKGTAQCGRNALVAWLILCGNTNLNEATLKRLNGSEKPVSLLELRQTSRSVGTEAKIRRYQLSRLKDVSRPFIAHLKSDGQERTGYHFTTVYGIDRGEIRMIDGTTGIKETRTIEDFKARWTGYALIKARPIGTLPGFKPGGMWWPLVFMLGAKAVIVVICPKRKG